MGKIQFLTRILSAYLARQDKQCPFCSSSNTTLSGRKYFVLQLRRCADCKLRFRWPKDTPSFNRRFYQRTYRQAGLTTDLPDPEALRALTASQFAGTEKDFSEKIAILKRLVPQGAVLDFGCSWGYASYQLQRAGYQVVGFEVSEPRAAYGRAQLNTDIVSTYEALDKLEGRFDVIFSSHVLEHLPNFNGVFERFRTLLKPAGALLLFVPNCGGRNATELGIQWGPLTCEKHPQSLDAAFFESALPRFGFTVRVFSDPYAPSAIAKAVADRSAAGSLTGDELMVFATRSGN